MAKAPTREELKAFAAEAAKGIKTQEDLNKFAADLLKITVESALNAELDHHLGYPKHSPKGKNTGNSRNGFSSKTLKGNHGQIELDTPRDRNGTFEPQLVPKGQTRFTAMDDQILCLYAKGMTTREIVAAFKEMYGADISAGLVSQVTNSVKDRIVEWQNRPLEPIYPVVFMDCLVVKVRHAKKIINKSVYLALGVNLEGHKELLGLWISENEGSKFWLSILTELQNRGVSDILIACIDGLKGFPEAIQATYPKTQVQMCIIHMIRNSLKYVSWKDYKTVTTGLKKIYQSVTEEEAALELDRFAEVWDEKYPRISKSWRNHWSNLITIFEYPQQIRKAIYTTNAIESLNSVIRKGIKKRKFFPNDEAALKMIYLAVIEASRRWTRPISNWKLAINRFIIEFEDRLTPYL